MGGVRLEPQSFEICPNSSQPRLVAQPLPVAQEQRLPNHTSSVLKML